MTKLLDICIAYIHEVPFRVSRMACYWRLPIVPEPLSHDGGHTDMHRLFGLLRDGHPLTQFRDPVFVSIQFKFVPGDLERAVEPDAALGDRDLEFEKFFVPRILKMGTAVLDSRKLTHAAKHVNEALIET